MDKRGMMVSSFIPAIALRLDMASARVGVVQFSNTARLEEHLTSNTTDLAALAVRYLAGAVLLPFHHTFLNEGHYLPPSVSFYTDVGKRLRTAKALGIEIPIVGEAGTTNASHLRWNNNGSHETEVAARS